MTSAQTVVSSGSEENLKFLLKFGWERADNDAWGDASTLVLDRGSPGKAGNAGTLLPMARVRLFASAREAAGTGTDAFDGTTVSEVLAAAEHRYGSNFSNVLSTCRIWVNGDDVGLDAIVGPNDEVAVLPPVSGGCT